MAAMKIGVVGVPDGWSSQRLTAAVAERTGSCQLLWLARASADLGSGRVHCGESELGCYDALIIKKLGKRYAPELLDRLELLRFVEAQGVRIFSRPGAIMRLLDRLSCTVTLRMAQIPMPETVITEDAGLAVDAVQRFGSAILKPLYTTKARGMVVVNAGAEARAAIRGFQKAGNRILYVQRKVPVPGRDLGIAFLGGEYLASYARVARWNSWNTTTDNGGHYQPAEPAAEIVELARRAQAPFGLDFTCVDVVETDSGPLVFEVSAFGGFRGLLEANGIDAAGRYADYVLRKLGDEG